jgi:hypothetical protein
MLDSKVLFPIGMKTIRLLLVGYFPTKMAPFGGVFSIKFSPLVCGLEVNWITFHNEEPSSKLG